MFVKVDWISFSLTWSQPNGRGGEELWANMSAALNELGFDHLPEKLNMLTTWERQAGRAPYRESLFDVTSGARIYYHENLQHCLFELSGVACDWLERHGNLYYVLNAVQSRLTRIDIAADMLTDTRPSEFVAMRDEKRFKSSGSQISESGETFYLGSRHSNRFCRVYRYNPPHERSHLLRCEFQIKAEDARRVPAAIFADGIESVAEAMKEKFGFKHPCWSQRDVSPAEIKAWRPDRAEGKTLFWLADTVAPLLARLQKEGVIDVNTWIEENVKPLIEKEN